MDIKQQTKNVAAQGRYGDSMLLHVNPAEVRGLASAMPITINPETGQPEAFLPFLAPILGSVLGPSVFAGLGATGALTGLAGSALGSGLAQYAVTGDLKKGLLAGLTGYGVGAALQGAGAAASGAAEATQAASTAAESAAAEAIASGASDAAVQEAVMSSLGDTAASQAAAQTFVNPVTEAVQNLPYNIAPSAVEAGAQAAASPTAFQNLKSAFTAPGTIDPATGAIVEGSQGFSLGAGGSNLLQGALQPSAYIPAGVGMGGTAIMESQEAYQRMLDQLDEDERRRVEEMYARYPEMIPGTYVGSAGGGLTAYANGGATKVSSQERFSDLPKALQGGYKLAEDYPDYLVPLNETNAFGPNGEIIKDIVSVDAYLNGLSNDYKRILNKEKTIEKQNSLANKLSGPAYDVLTTPGRAIFGSDVIPPRKINPDIKMTEGEIEFKKAYEKLLAEKFQNNISSMFDKKQGGLTAYQRGGRAGFEDDNFRDFEDIGSGISYIGESIGFGGGGANPAFGTYVPQRQANPIPQGYMAGFMPEFDYFSNVNPSASSLSGPSVGNIGADGMPLPPPVAPQFNPTQTAAYQQFYGSAAQGVPQVIDPTQPTQGFSVPAYTPPPPPPTPPVTPPGDQPPIDVPPIDGPPIVPPIDVPPGLPPIKGSQPAVIPPGNVMPPVVGLPGEPVDQPIELPDPIAIGRPVPPSIGKPVPPGGKPLRDDFISIGGPGGGFDNVKPMPAPIMPGFDPNVSIPPKIGLPEPKPVQLPEPMPIAPPMSRQEPEPVQLPDPIAMPILEPIAQPMPIAAPVPPMPVQKPMPEPIAMPMPEPIASPQPMPMPEPIAMPDPVVMPMPAPPMQEPIALPVPEPIAAPVPKPVLPPVMAPVMPPVNVPMPMPIAQPLPVAQPMPIPRGMPMSISRSRGRSMKDGGDTKFPDLSGDGKVTQKDILIGKGVIEKFAGGNTELVNDPLTKNVIDFIMGNIQDDSVVAKFIDKYGPDIFRNLRRQVLASLAPNAQTEGMIEGDNKGGMADDIYGVIGDPSKNGERVAVSQDEFIVPADVVSMLGDGSSDAGADKLYAMMDKVRQEKTNTTKQAKPINDRRVMPS